MSTDDDMAEYVRRMEDAVAKAHLAITKLKSKMELLEKENSELHEKLQNYTSKSTGISTNLITDVVIQSPTLIKKTPSVPSSAKKPLPSNIDNDSKQPKPNKSSKVITSALSTYSTTKKPKYHMKLDQTPSFQAGWSNSLKSVTFNEIARNKYSMPDLDANSEYELIINDYKDISLVGTTIKLPIVLCISSLLSAVTYENLYTVGRTLATHVPAVVAKQIYMHMRNCAHSVMSSSANVLLCTSLSKVPSNDPSAISLLGKLRFPVLSDLLLFIRQRLHYGKEFIRDVLLYLRLRTLAFLKKPNGHTLLRSMIGPSISNTMIHRSSIIPSVSDLNTMEASKMMSTDLGNRQELAELWDMDSYCSDDQQADTEKSQLVSNTSETAVVTSTETDSSQLISLFNPSSSLLMPFPTLFGATLPGSSGTKTKEQAIDILDTIGTSDEDSNGDQNEGGSDDDMKETTTFEDEEIGSLSTTLKGQLVRAWQLFVLLTFLGPECGGMSGDAEKLLLDVMNVFAINSPSIAPFLALLWLKSETAKARLGLQELSTSASVNDISVIRQFSTSITVECENWVLKLPETNNETNTRLCDQFLTLSAEKQKVEASVSHLQEFFIDLCLTQFPSASRDHISSSLFTITSLSCRILGFWPCTKLLTQQNDLSIVGLDTVSSTVDSLMSIVKGHAQSSHFRSCLFGKYKQSVIQSKWDSFFTPANEVILSTPNSTSQNEKSVDLQSITKILNVFSFMFQSFLSSDFEPLLNIWHSGEAGVGQPSQQLAQTLLDSAQGHIRRICSLSRRSFPRWNNSISLTDSASSSESTSYAPCSLSNNTLQSVLSILEFLHIQFFPLCDSMKSENANTENAVETMLVNKLRRVQQDLFSLLSCVAFEQLVGLALNSAKAAVVSLETALPNEPLCLEPEFRRHATSFVSVVQRLLTSVTTPWSGKSSPETFLTLSAASRCLQVLTNEATPESSVGRVGLFMSKLKPSVQHSDDGVNTWRAYQSSLLPTFIINLESRRDRWNHMTESCEKAGLLHVRVRAVDGTNSNDGCNDTVSIDDISLTWDSTVHSEYESSYPVNDSIAMTPTERACAASHLRTWRWIANIRQQLFQAPFPSSGRITADDMSLSLNDSSHLFASCNLGGGWSCINLDIDSNKDHHPSHLQTTGFGANDDWYLILEDDANIPTLPSHGYTQSDFRAKLSEIIHMYTPSDFDILYLGYSSSAACKMTNINKVVVKPSYLWSLHAYVLRGRAVNKLLSQLPIRAPVDKFIASLVLDGHLQAYALREKLVSLTETTRLSLPNVHHSGRVGNVRVRKYQNKPSTLTSKRKKK